MCHSTDETLEFNDISGLRCICNMLQGETQEADIVCRQRWPVVQRISSKQGRRVAEDLCNTRAQFFPLDELWRLLVTFPKSVRVYIQQMLQHLTMSHRWQQPGTCKIFSNLEKDSEQGVTDITKLSHLQHYLQIRLMASP